MNRKIKTDKERLRRYIERVNKRETPNNAERVVMYLFRHPWSSRTQIAKALKISAIDAIITKMKKAHMVLTKVDRKSGTQSYSLVRGVGR